MSNLYRTITSESAGGLVTGISPAVEVGTGVIRKLAAAATVKRGTILAKSSGTAGDGKLVILGTAAASNETLTAYGVLCDDMEVGTSADVNAAIYVAGCFDPDKLIVASGHTITEAEKDALRNKGFALKSVQ